MMQWRKRCARFEGGVETVSTIYLVDSNGTLAGAVPLAKLVLAPRATPLLSLTQEPLIASHVGATDKEVAELFDKYNLLTLPVIDDRNRLTGVITSDDVIEHAARQTLALRGFHLSRTSICIYSACFVMTV